MPAAFGALGNNGIGAQALHAFGERGGSHDGDDLDTGLFPHAHIVGGAASAGGDHIDFQIDEQLGKLGGVGVHEHDVGADGFVGDLAGSRNLLLHPFQRRAAAGDDAQAAGGADGASQAGIGDARHGTLYDGLLNAQKLSDTGIHIPRSYSRKQTSNTPDKAMTTYREMVVQAVGISRQTEFLSRFLRLQK